MNQKIKNSETPYFSTSPVQDQFGQLIVAFGITKREKLAMDIFMEIIRGYTVEDIIEEKNQLFDKSYFIADEFLNYEPIKEEPSNIIL
jgi:hypothetical protein